MYKRDFGCWLVAVVMPSTAKVNINDKKMENKIKLKIERLIRVQKEQSEEFEKYSDFYTKDFMQKQGNLINDKIKLLQSDLQS